MYKQCKTEQSAARQRELEKALLAAMGHHPFDEISISALCAQAEIPRKSFYRYFSSKEGALYALLDHTLIELETVHLSADTIRHLSMIEYLERFFQYWQDNKLLLDGLSRSGLEGLLVQRTIHLVTGEEAVFSEQTYLSPPRKGPGNWAALVQVCGLLSMVLHWYHLGYRESPAQMAEIAREVLTKPLLPDNWY